MKAKLLFTAFLSLSIIGFIATTRSGKSSYETIHSIQDIPPVNNKFIIGALDNAYDLDYNKTNDLGLNTWHQYSAPMDKGWLFPGGGYDPTDNINSISVPTNVGYRLDQNEQEGVYSLMDRPKFEYLAYGQRSDYQCESLSVNARYWFYSYATHNIGHDISDSGQMVRHCTTNDGEGWIVKDLKSNREQANYFWNQWNNDDYYKWYVMPKIRIRPEDALLNKRVCRIDILKWDGTLVDSIIINSFNFLDPQNIYNGQYLSEYFNPGGGDLEMQFGPGPILNPDSLSFTSWDTPCGIDFRVHYYNECEMWIDYVRLENEPANLLFRGLRDDWITQEVENAVAHGGNSSWRFYMDEYEFNTVPCMAYLNKKIDSIASSHGKNMSLMSALNYDLFQAHIPFFYYWNDPMTAEDIAFYLIDRANLKELFAGAYPFQGYGDDIIPNNLYAHNQIPPPTYHPSTLTELDFEYTAGRLSNVTTPTNYDNWLQTYLDDSSNPSKLLPILKLGDKVSKISNIPFINLMQAHLWWVRNPNGHRLKEPTNQELELIRKYLTARTYQAEFIFTG